MLNNTDMLGKEDKSNMINLSQEENDAYIIFEESDYHDRNDDWTVIAENCHGEYIKDTDIVDLWLWDDCIELLRYPENINSEKSLDIDYVFSKTDINTIKISVKYYDAKMILPFLGYELYHEDSRSVCIDPLREYLTIVPCHFF